MKSRIENLLTSGLLEGYAKRTTRGKVIRGLFNLETSHLEQNGDVYHDEWLAARTGGGQELAQVGGERFTRLYAGGTISHEKLQQLGLTKKDVTNYLKRKITELAQKGIKTRLNEDCQEKDGDWGYSYNVVNRYEDIPLTVGLETIEFKDTTVFVHVHLLCPIE